MTFDGLFADSLVVEQLDKISLSFLTEDLQVRRGGVAANIAFGMANLGQRPVLVGAVGEDFTDYRSWLERHGVDCASVHYSESQHTARFICTTDRDMAQIATFYAGAMTEARDIELAARRHRVGGLDLVVVGANDPEAMLRHSDECRSRGIPFAADPSQQLAFCDGADHRTPHRRRRVPLHQRVREPPRLPEDRLERGRARRPRPACRSRPAARTASPSACAARSPSRCGDRPRGAQGRPDRRRRRLPGRLPHRSRRRACRSGGAPSSARCSPPTSSRRSARRSTSWARTRFLERLTEAYGAESADEIGRTSSATRPCRADARARRPAPSERLVPTPPPPTNWDFALDRCPRRGPHRRRRRPRGADALRGVLPRRLPDGHRRPRRRADRVVVARPARRAAAARPPGAALAAQVVRPFEVRVDTDFRRRRRGLRRPRPDGRWITPEIVARLRGLHAPAGRTRSRRGRTASSSAGSTASRSAGSSPASRCSTTSATPRRWRSSACATCSPPTVTRRRLLDVQWQHAAPGHARVREVPRDEYLAILPTVLRAPLPARWA